MNENNKLRKRINQIFSGIGFLAVFSLILSVLILLGPIIYKGAGAFLFQGTCEFRRVILEQFGRGDRREIVTETENAALLKAPIYHIIMDFEKNINPYPAKRY